MSAQAPRASRSRSAPAKETTKHSQGGHPKLERGLSCAQDSSKSSQGYFCVAVDGGRAYSGQISWKQLAEFSPSRNMHKLQT